MSEDVDEVGWAVEPGDEMAPMIEVVGGVIKFHREAAGMSVTEFGVAMQYGEDLIRKVERGARIPRVEFLYSADEETAARMPRKSIFEREPAPTPGFVQEQVTLERPLGGKMVWRRQLEHLLEVGQLRNVTLQVMPTDLEEHAGTQGLIQVLKFADGTAVGRSEGAFNGRPVSSPRDLRILELRCTGSRAATATAAKLATA